MYHTELDRLIQTHLPASLQREESVRQLMAEVSERWSRKDRDRQRAERAFEDCQAESRQVNTELKHLSDQQKRSLTQLKRAVADLIGAEPDGDSELDLVSISEIIRGQVHLNEMVKDELSRSINIFKALMNNLKSAALIENEHGEILYTNDLFCEYFKCALIAEEIIGADANEARKQAKQLFEEPDAFLEGIARILERRMPVYNERLQMRDGRILERDYVPIFVEGKYRGHLWKFDDVTSRARYEDSLRESEERNRLILDSALDAVVITNAEGNIEGWNPQAEELFGWSREEAYGRNAAELILPAELRESQVSDITQHLDRAMDRFKNQVMEMMVVNRDGSTCTVELGLVSYRQLGSDYYVGFFRNIEARKFAERRLKKQEEKYRNIISDMNLGLLNIDLDHKIVYANQTFCDMTGYSMEELLGSHTDMFKYDDSSKDLARSKMELARQGISDTMEIQARNKAGERRSWFVSGGPTYNDRGEQTGAVVIHLDISDQKRLEQELEVAKTTAERASVAKETFLANMSHEIRTPLNAIIGMIRELGRERLSSQQQTYLSHTDSAARHLLSIVNSILDLSKIEAGELELDLQDFSLEALVANIQSILHIKAARKGLELHCEVSDAIWSAHLGDSSRIRQVLINLLGNAIKFTLEGGVSLRADVVREDARGQTIRIEVEDTGIGMDQEYLGEIFSKFSQADRTTSRRFGGTGLGMSITKEMIRLMDGSIEVSSKQGVGTKFVIHLTLERGDLDKLTGPADGDRSHLLRDTHILLVEDNVMNRFIAGKCLSHFGCTVDEAENGLIALDLLRQRRYDLVLMDIQMPELDGVATTKIIRGELQLDVPIIAVTANAFKKDIDLYLSIGMNAYVTKPFEEQAMFETLVQQLPAKQQGVDHPHFQDRYDLRSLRALSHDDEEFVGQMVGIFVDTTPDAIREIRSALQERDYLRLAKTAHRIKPGIESMGITQLDGVAKEIELYAKSGEVEHAVLAAKVSHFTGTLLAVIDRIREDELAME